MSFIARFLLVKMSTQQYVIIFVTVHNLIVPVRLVANTWVSEGDTNKREV